MSFKLEESKLRTKVAGSSKRPRNALEKATKKKKKPQNKELKYSIVDSVAGSIQTALPCTPILQSVGQPNIMPRYMHFGQPCDFSQAQIQLPTTKDWALISSQMTSTTKTHDNDMKVQDAMRRVLKEFTWFWD
ncbi:hypothetical protein ACFX1W_019036 [Malus domestica]